MIWIVIYKHPLNINIVGETKEDYVDRLLISTEMRAWRPGT